MASIDIFNDAPGLLRSESLSITLAFNKTSPTTGKISWNIPTPAAGCTAATQAYCGMLITINTKINSPDNAPQHGVIYSDDPTVDPDLFVGDKISGAYVVFATYNDRVSDSVDISGLDPNKQYYVSGYPVDCEGRYLRTGVHAYSQELKKHDALEGTSGTQRVTFPSAVDAALVTGLDPTMQYCFKLQVGANPVRPIGVAVNKFDCVELPAIVEICIDGCDATTFGDLVDAINRQLEMSSNAPFGNAPPGAGLYYWNAKQQVLYYWDGYTLAPANAIILTPRPPATELELSQLIFIDSAGKYFHITGPAQSDIAYNLVVQSCYDPIAPEIGSVWINKDNKQAYEWNGTMWCAKTTIFDVNSPIPDPATFTGFWYDNNTTEMKMWAGDAKWISVDVIVSTRDPDVSGWDTNQQYYWHDQSSSKLNEYQHTDGSWRALDDAIISEVKPKLPKNGQLWYKESTNGLKQWDEASAHWIAIDNVWTYFADPTDRESCQVWWNPEHNDFVYMWSELGGAGHWVKVDLYVQGTDPLDNGPDQGSYWYNGTDLYVWIGDCFKNIECFALTDIPIADNPMVNPYGNTWFDVIWVKDDGTTFVFLPDSTVNVPQGGKWVEFQAVSYEVLIPGTWEFKPGTLWFDPVSGQLMSWNGQRWVSVTYVKHSPVPEDGTLWFDTGSCKLKQWRGEWLLAQSRVTVSIDCNGYFEFIDHTTGNDSYVSIQKDALGSYGTLWGGLITGGTVLPPTPGSDAVSDTPSYLEEGVGTDGTDADRKAIANDIRYALGYPIVSVELTDSQIDLCIKQALEQIRQRSSAAYKRSFFMMSIQSNTQKYTLTDRSVGMHKIVNVMGVYRLTSAFLSSAHGAGVYGQVILQQLYNMGTYDLTSHFMMSQYVSLMEQLFASRVTFTWDESTRTLWLLNRFPYRETKVLLEATVERTEQELLRDRLLLPTIRKWTEGLARLMLSEIRGKFSTLPSASGGVSLNSDALRQQGNQMILDCIEEIEDNIADTPEEYGRYDITWG